MADRAGSDQSHEDEVASERVRRENYSRTVGGTAVFNRKGIGSNVFLTAAAAAVPLVIIGASGVMRLLGAKNAKRR